MYSPDRFWEPGYAESDDGVDWRKPELDQIAYLNRPTNRLQLDSPIFLILCLVFENPDPGAPDARRFGCYWIESGRNAEAFTTYRFSRRPVDGEMRVTAVDLAGRIAHSCAGDAPRQSVYRKMEWAGKAPAGPARLTVHLHAGVPVCST